MKLLVSLLFTLSAVSSLPGCAEHRVGGEQDFAALDDFIREAKSTIGMPSGTAVVVLEGQDILHEGYYGYADIANNKHVDAETVFYIASTAKAFLALATLLAEERGDLTENTTLQELFPNTVFARIDAEKVTVRHLLTHTSGLDNESMTWAGSYTGLHDNELRHEMLAATYPSVGAALGEFEYSNLGYNTMSIWFDDYYGKDWRDTLRETVLAPLGMKHSSAYMSDAEKNGWLVAKPYTYKVAGGKEAIYLQKTDSTMFSIGLIATAQDTARFISAQMNAGRVDGAPVFSAEVISKSQERQVDHDGGYFDGYAWGWMTDEFDGRRINFHTGGFSGASVQISYMPDEHIGVVVIHNEGGLKANYMNGMISDAVYSQLLGKSAHDVKALNEPRLEELVTAVDNANARIAQQARDFSAMTWNLSREVAAYRGAYVHRLGGAITISAVADDSLYLEWGNLKGTAFPHEEGDLIQVNFRPGSYDAIKFQVVDERVNSLEFNGVVFDRQ